MPEPQAALIPFMQAEIVGVDTTKCLQVSQLTRTIVRE